MSSAKTPMASIGVPVYNSERFLERTLSALLKQTFADFELIISDNASTDRTPELCQDHARSDFRIRYVRQTSNIGAPRNYNAVLRMARGKYFKWSSSNDLCAEVLIERCITILEARPDAVLAYAKTRFFDDESGMMQDYEDNLDLQADDPVKRYIECGERCSMNNVWNGVMRTNSLKASTLNWDYIGSDRQLTQELTLHGKFIEIPEFLFFRRLQDGARYGEGTRETYHEYYPDEEFGSTRQLRLRLAQGVRGVGLAPVGRFDKLRLYSRLARQAWWGRRELLGLKSRDAGTRPGVSSNPVSGAS